MKKIFILLFFCSYSEYSYAYFDPGTGAFIVQAILAFFAAVAFYLGYPIRLFKKLILKIKEKFFKKKP
jgi:hypothetical protein